MLLDVFNDDAFGVVSLTEAINMLPSVPSRIGSMGLFTPKPISTTAAAIEERNGRLSLLSTKPRGSGDTQTGARATRHVRSVTVPHIPTDDAVLADEIQGVRAFGEESETEVFNDIVNEKLGEMRQDLETTWEYHRAGALQGVVLDSDGSTEIVNLFTLFGVTEYSINFDFTATNGGLKAQCTTVQRHVRDALGQTAWTGLHAMCGDAFFDALIKCPEVRDSYLRWKDGEFYRTVQGANAEVFEWGGIRWENYRASVGSVDFLPSAKARIFPVGAPTLYRVFYAPADYVETVNTKGRPFYAKQERMRFDKGVELQAQSNPLHICTRPRSLVEATYTDI